MNEMSENTLNEELDKLLLVKTLRKFISERVQDGDPEFEVKKLRKRID